MNKIILLGYVSKLPELHKSSGEKQVNIARFDLAVNKKGKYKDQNEADYFHCTAFGNTAIFIEKYFDVGSKMLLTGRVENNNYTNNNGEKVYSYQVIVEEVEFADKKPKDEVDE